MSQSQSQLVRYGGFSVEALERTAAQADQIAGSNFVEVKVGTNVYRAIPPPVGRDTPFRVTAIHYIDAIPGLERMLVFACPRVELKEPCLACQKSEELSRSPSPIDREKAYDLSAGLRVYMPIVDRAIDGPDGIKVWAFGKQVLNQLKEIRRNPRLGGDYTNPMANGFDLIVTREGTGKNDTKYTVSAARDACPLAPTTEMIQEIIDSQPDLNALVNPIVPEELLRIWGQVTMQVPMGAPMASAPALSERPGARFAAQPRTHVAVPVASIPSTAVPAYGTPAAPRNAVTDAQAVEADDSWLNG